MSSLPANRSHDSLDPRRRSRGLRSHQPAGFLVIAIPRIHDIHLAIARLLVRVGIMR